MPDTDVPICADLDPMGQELLELMLVYDPASRISAKQACNHPYFDDLVRPLPTSAPAAAAAAAGTRHHTTTAAAAYGGSGYH